MSGDHRDMVITALADSEAELREHIDRLLGIMAGLAFENFLLRRVAERELVARINSDGQLARERAQRYAQRDRAA
jgi:hypothetical protein